MVILEPDRGGATVHLLEHRVRKAPVDAEVPLPMPPADPSQVRTQMAERPQKLVGVTQVVSVDVVLAQPDAPERVLGVVRRHAAALPGVHHGGVRLAAPPRDPRPAQRLEDRIKRRGQPSCGLFDLHFTNLACPFVLVRLAIGHNDEALVRKAAPEKGFESGGADRIHLRDDLISGTAVPTWPLPPRRVRDR